MRLLAGLALALLIAAPVAAAPRPAAWTFAHANFEWVIEQQTPGGSQQSDPALQVRNVPSPYPFPPSQCVWDADDEVTFWIAGAYIAPGASVGGSICIIADTMPHLAGMEIQNPELVGSIRFDEYVTVPVLDRACVVGPQYRDTDDQPAYPPRTNPAFQPILGSNGGNGRYVVVTYTLTNPTSKRVRNVAARATVMYYGYTATQDYWCPSGALIWQTGRSVYPAGHDPAVWWSN
jgi:hypothetical protein